MLSRYPSRLCSRSRLRPWLFFCFPLFLNLLLYCNLIPSPALAQRTPNFTLELPGLLRFLLSFLLIALAYLVLTLLCHKPWLAAALLSLPLYVVSLVDYYKYYALGTRICAEDITMIFSLGDLWTPKGASGNGFFLSPLVFLTAPLLLLYVHGLRVLRVGEALHFSSRRLLGGTLAAWLILSFSSSSLAYQIFDPQLQDYQVVTSSTQKGPQLTSIDCLIGSLYYTKFTDERATEPVINQLLAPYQQSGATSPGVTPDIIVIMSESYFDLNRVSGIELLGDPYKNFRRMQQSGRIAVPAFGGGTASTEYEVLSGTANSALQNTRSPYGGITSQQQLPTFVDYFKGLGYETSYIHPFKSSFYNRRNAMTAMGFDHLFFQENLAVEPQPYERDMHISDQSLNDQIYAQLDAGAGKPQFIWATSMQNHNPYVTQEESDPILVQDLAGDLTPGELDGLNAYAVGISDTDAALGRLLDYVDSAPRPTALLFFGDHQPLLEGYKQHNNIQADNLYENLDNLTTDYGIYSNFTQPTTPAVNQTFSAFYLMPVMLRSLGMPQAPYQRLLLDCLPELPVYGALIETGGLDPQKTQKAKDAIDILSYDRALGQKWSRGAAVA